MTDIASGDTVAQHLKPRNGQQTLDGGVPEYRIQPNGVDLGIAAIYRTRGTARFGSDDYHKPSRMTLEPKAIPAEGWKQAYVLRTGTYIIEYDVEVEIPEGYVGHVYPRSRVMRSGLHLTTALWDQGYEGVGEGQLQVPMSLDRVTIAPDACLAQMTFQPANVADDLYDGSHQGEGKPVVQQ